MKRLILWIIILISQRGFSLEIERATPIKMGKVLESKRIKLEKASEIWVKGIPGKRVKLEVPSKLRESNERAGINMDRIYLEKDTIVLDGQGKGKFRMKLRAKVRGDGEVYGEIPLRVEYVN